MIAHEDITLQTQMELNLRRREALLEAAARISGLLLTSTSPSDVLGAIVRLIGEASGQDRSYYFAWVADSRTKGVTISLQHEWVREGVSPQQGNPELQTLPFDKVAPCTCERIRHGQEVCSHVRDLPVAERAILEAQQIVSILLVPVMVNGQPVGFIGFDKCQSAYVWTSGERAALEVVAGNLGAAIAWSWAAEALKASEMRFQCILQNVATVAVQGYSMDGTVRYWNRASEAFYGYTAEEALGRNLLELIIPPDMSDRVRAAILSMTETGEVVPAAELTLLRKDGTSLSVYSSHALVRVPGQEAELFCIDTDLTACKQAEAEREKLQAQLAQAQKMESVGRLAGGVAHDFNNMLGVILGETELALAGLEPAAPLRGSLEVIRKAAERSTELTRQLLAFARKQAVVPQVIDLNATVAGVLKMLRRLIGEDIELDWLPAKDLAPVKIDPAQVDQLLDNLCVNARDAIAGVGKVVIATDNVSFSEDNGGRQAGYNVPGEYVLLTVTDNGCGMSQETLGHLFEPFYTTKEVGKGTGLGLATVYGMVKQNNGFINVASEFGKGTAFRIYLPRAAVKTVHRLDLSPAPTTARGSERILLVEDEPAILMMTAKMLERLGYSVHAASSPAEAIRLAREQAGSIDLLLTDVVMPEMSGRDLANELLSICPDLKRLFTSGYTADIIAHHGVMFEGIHFIQKPFSMNELGLKIRAALADGRLQRLPNTDKEREAGE